MNPWLPFVLCLVVSATPWCSSALALILGLIVSLGFRLHTPEFLRKNGKFLMQAAIVAMGFSMDPVKVLSSGSQGVSVTFVTLMVAMTAGFALAKIFKVTGTTGTLISAGTGICGGSAIASLAPVLKSKHEEIAVAMATVFCLNAVALIVFPVIGRALHMTPEQFGWFAAIAIHDTSSVVGAATEFHPDSVPIAVTAKLTRALWIIPMILVTALIVKWKARGTAEPHGKITIPWFIGVFVLAVILHGVLPDMPNAYHASDVIGKAALKMAIFLIGTQMTRQTLKTVGPKAMGMAVTLWFCLSVVTLYWVKNYF